MGEMRRLLVTICAMRARAEVCPANAFCRRPIRRWLSGAEMRKPYMAILMALALTCAFPSTRAIGEASFGTLVGDPDRLLPRTSCRKDKVPAPVSR